MYLRYEFGSETKARIFLLSIIRMPGSQAKTSLIRMEKTNSGPWPESYKLSGLQSGYSHHGDMGAAGPATERAVVPV